VSVCVCVCVCLCVSVCSCVRPCLWRKFSRKYSPYRRRSITHTHDRWRVIIPSPLLARDNTHTRTMCTHTVHVHTHTLIVAVSHIHKIIGTRTYTDGRTLTPLWERDDINKHRPCDVMKIVKLCIVVPRSHISTRHS